MGVGREVGSGEGAGVVGKNDGGWLSVGATVGWSNTSPFSPPARKRPCKVDKETGSAFKTVKTAKSEELTLPHVARLTGEVSGTDSVS